MSFRRGRQAIAHTDDAVGRHCILFYTSVGKNGEVELVKLLKTFALAEGTKSNDSWCVGEVDPGKRLVFRKSLSCKYPVHWCGVWCTYMPPALGTSIP